MSKRKPMSVTGVLLLCNACGGGSDAVSISYGYGNLVDSAVQGVSFQSGGRSGITDAAGAFSYEVGQPLTFKIGDIQLGQIAGSATVSPLTLANSTMPSDAKASNIARFLQTLDDDGIPANGIQITQNVRDIATGKSIDFSVGKTEFSSDTQIQTIVSQLTAATNAGARALVAETDAEAHVTDSLVSILSSAMGTYYGNSSTSVTCNDSRYNSNTVSDGSIAFSLGNTNSQGITFTALGSFSTTVSGITVREDMSISTNTNTISLTGEIHGMAVDKAYRNGVYAGSASTLFSGQLDGKNITLKFPGQTGVTVTSGVICDLSGATIKLKKSS